MRTNQDNMGKGNNRRGGPPPEPPIEIPQEYTITPLGSQMTVLASVLRENLMNQSPPAGPIVVYFPTASQSAIMAGVFNKIGFNVLEYHNKVAKIQKRQVDRVCTNPDTLVFTTDNHAPIARAGYHNLLVVQVGRSYKPHHYRARLREASRAITLLADFEALGFVPALHLMGAVQIKPKGMQTNFVNKGLASLPGSGTASELYSALIAFYYPFFKKSPNEMITAINQFMMSLYKLQSPPALYAETARSLGMPHQGVEGIDIVEGSEGDPKSPYNVQPDKKHRKPNQEEPQAQVEAPLPDPPKPKGVLGEHFTKTAFNALDISPLTKNALAQMGMAYMTDIQEASIPQALQGFDIHAQAKTGTGKTLAFLIPILELLAQSPNTDGKAIPMLVITPTRELASQIEDQAQKLCKFHKFPVATCYGGVSGKRDKDALSKRLDIIVATPGRLYDNLAQNLCGIQAKIQGCKFLVLDEMDRLLDEGFWDSIARILKYLPPTEKRQTMLFSATVPDRLQKLMASITRPQFLRKVKMIKDEDVNVQKNVAQEFVVVPIQQQIQSLVSILRNGQKKPGYKIICFFTTARQTGAMAGIFQTMGFPVLEIHSRKSQSHRTKMSDQFKAGSELIIFSSDVIARGMDYPDVSMVVQVGRAADQEQYIHRLGRTARAGRSGCGVTLLCDFEAPKFAPLIEELGAKRTTVAPLTKADNILYEKGIQQLRENDDEPVQYYVSLLGFYKTFMKKMEFKNTTEMIAYFNRYFCDLYQLDAPPAIQASTVGKMGLKGVPGIRIDSGPRQPRGGGGGGGASKIAVDRTPAPAPVGNAGGKGAGGRESYAPATGSGNGNGNFNGQKGSKGAQGGGKGAQGGKGMSSYNAPGDSYGGGKDSYGNGKGGYGGGFNGYGNGGGYGADKGYGNSYGASRGYDGYEEAQDSYGKGRGRGQRKGGKGSW